MFLFEQGVFNYTCSSLTKYDAEQGKWLKNIFEYRRSG